MAMELKLDPMRLGCAAVVTRMEKSVTTPESHQVTVDLPQMAWYGEAAAAKTRFRGASVLMRTRHGRVVDAGLDAGSEVATTAVEGEE